VLIRRGTLRKIGRGSSARFPKPLTIFMTPTTTTTTTNNNNKKTTTTTTVLTMSFIYMAIKESYNIARAT